MSAKRACRVCGCTEQAACDTPHGPCFWIAQDLCSGCVPVNLDGGLELAPEDFAALETVPMVSLQLDAMQAMMLMSALQLSLRHPEFTGGTARPFVTQLAAGLAQRVGVTPKLLQLALSGFVHEAQPKEPSSRLILPGDPGWGL